MHPYRGKLHMYRRSEVLSTIPDGLNIFIRQSAGPDDGPVELLRGPVPWNPTWTRPNTLRLCLWSRHLRRCRDFYEHTATLRSLPFLHLIHCRDPRHLHQKFHTIQWFRLDLTQGFLWDSTQVFPALFYPSHLTGFHSVFLTRFNSRFSTGFDSRFFYSIWLAFNAIVFNSSHIFRVPFQSGFRKSHIGQGVFEIIQHWNRGIFHNS